MTSEFNKRDIFDFSIEFKPILDLGCDITFGVELEFEKINCDLFNEILVNSLMKRWMVEEEEYTINGFGGEVISPILRDKKSDYNSIRKICHMINNLGGLSTDKTATHIHFGAHVLGNNIKNWVNLVRVWTAYENVIYQFAIADKDVLRKNGAEWAIPYSSDMDYFRSIYNKECDSKRFSSFIKHDMGIDFTKSDLSKVGNDDTFNKFENMNTIEFRPMNSTFNPVIIQNSINFFGQLINYACSSEFDSELIDYKINSLNNYHYENFDYGDALELSNLILKKEEDKMGFLKQCLLLPIKDISDKCFIKNNY